MKNPFKKKPKEYKFKTRNMQIRHLCEWTAKKTSYIENIEDLARIIRHYPEMNKIKSIHWDELIDVLDYVNKKR